MTQLISGHTKLIAHIGVPTESFRAPMIYNPYFQARDIDAVVMPMGCEASDYAEFLPLVTRLRNFIGAVITMPHKVTSVALLDEVSTTARICGACNAIRRSEDGRLIGDMFDGQGFTRGLLRKGRTIRGASALIVGSGGAGSAIAAALAEAGAARLGLFDVNSAATNQLAHRLRHHFPHLALTAGSNDPAGWEIVVNATPLGMDAGDAMPVDIDRISPDCFVGEVVMKQAETAFLTAARARGCSIQIGTDMLFEQIPAYLEFFGLPTTSPDELRRVARVRY